MEQTVNETHFLNLIDKDKIQIVGNEIHLGKKLMK